MFRSCSRDYLRLLAAAFLLGSATTSLSLFSVVLRHHWMAPPLIGGVISSGTVAAIPAALLAGTLAARCGAVPVIRLGVLLSLIGIAALPYVVATPAAAALAMASRGIGAGLVMPAGMLYAQSQSGDSDRTRLVGMFSAMFFIPSVFAPALAEWTLEHWGEMAFFALPMLPCLAALTLVCLLPQTSTPAPPNTAGYLALVRDRRLWLPSLATMGSGVGYAFAFTFLSLLLIETGVKVAAFFVPFALVLLLVRFVGLILRERKRPRPGGTGRALLRVPKTAIQAPRRLLLYVRLQCFQGAGSRLRTSCGQISCRHGNR